MPTPCRRRSGWPDRVAVEAGSPRGQPAKRPARARTATLIAAAPMKARIGGHLTAGYGLCRPTYGRCRLDLPVKCNATRAMDHRRSRDPCRDLEGIDHELLAAVQDRGRLRRRRLVLDGDRTPRGRGIVDGTVTRISSPAPGCQVRRGLNRRSPTRCRLGRRQRGSRATAGSSARRLESPISSAPQRAAVCALEDDRAAAEAGEALGREHRLDVQEVHGDRASRRQLRDV